MPKVAWSSAVRVFGRKVGTARVAVLLLGFRIWVGELKDSCGMGNGGCNVYLGFVEGEVACEGRRGGNPSALTARSFCRLADSIIEPEVFGRTGTGGTSVPDVVLVDNVRVVVVFSGVNLPSLD